MESIGRGLDGLVQVVEWMICVVPSLVLVVPSTSGERVCVYEVLAYS